MSLSNVVYRKTQFRYVLEREREREREKERHSKKLLMT